jgi:radical SAM superfamily enzyme YgiQ (UPF0313 family)
MQKILLINPPTTSSAYASVMPPLGLLYIDSYLRSKGEESVFIDLCIEKKWENRLEETFLKTDPEIIGITSNISNLSSVKKISEKIKTLKREVKIVVGGPLPSSSPELYLNAGVDYVVKGEGEITFYNFIKKKRPVEGMFIKDNGKISFTGEGESVANLDDLPFPSLDKIEIEKYFVNFSKLRPVSSLLTSRGCPFTCTFCNKSVFGSKWRARSSENVLSEIKWQVNKLGVKEICIMDDNFSLDKERVRKICVSILAEDINFSWQCQNGLRVENLDKGLLEQMKKSGCWKVGIAPEVGDEAVLAKIDKKLNLDDIREANNWCRKVGICVHAFFMIGFPFEDKESIEKTINFSIELSPVIADFAKVFPFPGPRLSEEYSSDEISEGGLYNIRLSPEKEKLYKQAYLRFYGRPSKIIDIIKNIGWKNLFRLSYYGLKIGLLN